MMIFPPNLVFFIRVLEQVCTVCCTVEQSVYSVVKTERKCETGERGEK